MIRHMKALVAALVLALAPLPVLAQQVANHAIPIGRGPGVIGFGAVPAAANTKFIVGGGTSADFVAATMSGDCTLAAGVVTCGKLNGVTAPSSGTSGGIVYYSSTSAMASSGALTANALVLGGGAGSAPTPMGSLGTTSTLLHGNASGAPTFGSVVSSDMNITTTSCTNQFVTAISAGGVGTCTTDTLAGAQHANQGTTTTVLHGNASGNPSWGAVNFATDGTGIVPAANGGAGTISGALKANGSGTVSQAAASDLSNGTTGSGSVVLAAGPALTGTVDVQQALALSGDISPTQITSNQNDYAPTGFSTASTMRLDIDADRSITGLAGGSDGRLIVIHNISTHSLTLTNQDTGSTAANRFLLGGDVALAPDTSITLRYDATSSRWRAIASAGSGGGGGGSGTVTSVAIVPGTGIACTGTCTITSSGSATIALADQYRQNDLLMCANQAKALAGYQRILETFCDGYKASDGINGGSSTNVDTSHTASGYVGPTFPTTTDALASQSNGTGSSSGGGVSNRLVIKVATLLGTTAGQIRVGIKGGTGGSSTISKVYVGEAASSGNAYAFDGNQVQLLNSGSASWTIPTGTVVFSDWINFSYDATKNLVVSAYNHSGFDSRTTSNANIDGYFLAGDSAATTTPATYTADGHTNYWLSEIQIRSSGLTNNMTLITTTQTADATVSSGRVLMEIDPIDSITLNTDLTAEVTCDSGSHWASATLSSVGKGQSGRTVVESADTSCGASTGTGFAARIKTLNNKSVNVYKTTATVH